MSLSTVSGFAQEWQALARETDPELRERGLRVLAGRLDRAGEPALAATVDDRPGSFGRRFEFLLGCFVREATSYRAILPMMLGAGAYQVGRALALGRLAGQPLAGGTARLLAGAFGMSLELPVFVGSGRLLDGRAGAASSPIERDFASAAITLSALKFAGLGSSALRRRISLPAAQTAIPALSLFVGLGVAHRVETGLGWRPAQDAAATVTDLLASMLSLSAGARLGHWALGPKFQGFLHHLSLRERPPMVASAALPGDRRRNSWLGAATLATCLAGCSVSGETRAGGALAALGLGWGALAMARSGRGSKVRIRPDTIEDPELREISDSTVRLHEQNPQHPEILRHTFELADRLSEMGDNRGDWLQAQLRQRREAHELKERIEGGIHEKFGIEAAYHLEMGGKSLVLTVNDGPGLTAASLGEFLRAGYAFPLTRLHLSSASPGDKRISGPLRVNENASGALLNKFRHLLSRALAGGQRESRFLRDMSFLVGGHRGIAELLEVLANSPALAKLTWLDLSENLVGDRGLQTLAQSPHLGELRYLELGNTGIGDAGARAIAGPHALGKLREIHLLQNKVGDPGARALAESRWLKNLQELELFDNEIGLEGARAIAGSEAFQNLKLLTLGDNAFGREGVLAILNSMKLQNLRGLDLSGNGFSYEELRRMISKENFPNLEVIDQLERDFEFD